jgi:hypothetical protein
MCDAMRCLVAELPQGEDRPHNVLGWMRALETVEKRVGAKDLITVFGDDAELLFHPNVMETTLGDAIRHGFLSKASNDGPATTSPPPPPGHRHRRCLPTDSPRHRLAIINVDGEITRVVGTSQYISTTSTIM